MFLFSDDEALMYSSVSLVSESLAERKYWSNHLYGIFKCIFSIQRASFKHRDSEDLQCSIHTYSRSHSHTQTHTPKSPLLNQTVGGTEAICPLAESQLCTNACRKLVSILTPEMTLQFVELQ